MTKCALFSQFLKLFGKLLGVLRSNQITGPTVIPVKTIRAETAAQSPVSFRPSSCSLFVSCAQCDLALAARHQTGGKGRRRLSDTEEPKTGEGGLEGGEKRDGTFALGVGLGFGEELSLLRRCDGSVYSVFLHLRLFSSLEMPARVH